MPRGTDVEQHVVQIDGADLGSSRQGRTDYLRLGTNAIADASAPLGLGVVFSVVSKSGTNQFAGDASLHVQARAWNANNDSEGVPAIADGTETEASLGGPLLRDRL